MKKLILVFGIIASAMCAKASYLYWTVAETTDGVSSYNGAILYATTTGTNSGGTALDSIVTPGATTTSLAGYEGAEYSYYIEYVNYAADYSSYNSVATGNAFTYDQLSGARFNDALSAAQMTAVWTGSAVVPTPEPTSGLLLLMGFAMLGLKRKKAV